MANILTLDANTTVDINVISTSLERLSIVLREETHLLKSRDITLTQELQAEKEELTNTLEKFQWLLANHPQMLNLLAEDQRKTLKKHGDALKSAVSDYRVELLKTERVQNIIIQLIRSALQQHVSPAIAYARSGSELDAKYKERFTPPIKINHSI